ncbi:MAG: hypothetical protein OXC62_11805 [Aestuariivita sp.]|nr:hypothetical protein [Aestuariivita sp.]
MLGIIYVVNACEPVPENEGAIADNTSSILSPNLSVEPSIDNDRESDQAVNAITTEEVQRNSGEQPLHASPDNPPPEMVGNPQISDENDFAAVAQRETITSDAERIAEFSSNYMVAQPVDLPDRSSSESPNIVKYALETNNLPGTRIYTRIGSILIDRFQRRCSRYLSSHQAQLVFLSNGGPTRDRFGLDPDGDGFACDWDPIPFRTAVRN